MDKEFEINQANKIKSKYVCDIVFKEESPYTLYCASDISNILEISNIRSVTINYNKEYKVKLLKHTNGGKQQVTFLTYLGLIRLLQNSRKTKSLELYNVLDIKVNNCVF